jgi:hypothetical protein
MIGQQFVYVSCGKYHQVSTNDVIKTKPFRVIGVICGPIHHDRSALWQRIERQAS